MKIKITYSIATSLVFVFLILSGVLKAQEDAPKQAGPIRRRDSKS